MRIPAWLAPLVVLITASCSSPPPATVMPPFDTTTSMKDLMANLVDPTADGVWEQFGTIDTKDGSFEKAPATDDDWNEVKAKAMTLVEVGNLLMLPARSGGNDEWVRKAQALITQSQRAIKAAADHDKEASFNIGADIYETCVSCHKQFDPAITSVR